MLRVGKSALLLVAAIAISLGIGEAVVRAFDLAPGVTRIEIHTPWAAFVPSESEILLYEPKPGAGDVNDYGARDFPFEVAKPPGAFRIVVLGDSIGFGFCNDRRPLVIEDTFPKVLERRLRERFGPRVQVLNLAVSGYDTVQEAELLARKGLALDPDLVLVAYCLNDAWQASAERVAFERGGMGELLGKSAAFRQLYLGSDLVRFVVQRSQLLSRRGAATDARQPDRTEQGFARIAELGALHRFETLVATFPLFQSFDAYPREAEHAAVAAKSSARGFHHLDLLPAFRAASAGDPRVLQGRCNREHPDERGHQVAAEAIERYLLDNDLIALPPH
jgi:lysophospholipase L1-like esterase